MKPATGDPIPTIHNPDPPRRDTAATDLSDSHGVKQQRHPARKLVDDTCIRGHTRISTADIHSLGMRAETGAVRPAGNPLLQGRQSGPALRDCYFATGFVSASVPERAASRRLMANVDGESRSARRPQHPAATWKLALCSAFVRWAVLGSNQ